jgi:hypothetical protein
VPADLDRLAELLLVVVAQRLVVRAVELVRQRGRDVRQVGHAVVPVLLRQRRGAGGAVPGGLPAVDLSGEGGLAGRPAETLAVQAAGAGGPPRGGQLRVGQPRLAVGERRGGPRRRGARARRRRGRRLRGDRGGGGWGLRGARARRTRAQGVHHERDDPEGDHGAARETARHPYLAPPLRALVPVPVAPRRAAVAIRGAGRALAVPRVVAEEQHLGAVAIVPPRGRRRHPAGLHRERLHRRGLDAAGHHHRLDRGRLDGRCFHGRLHGRRQEHRLRDGRRQRAGGRRRGNELHRWLHRSWLHRGRLCWGWLCWRWLHRDRLHRWLHRSRLHRSRLNAGCLHRRMLRGARLRRGSGPAAIGVRRGVSVGVVGPGRPVPPAQQSGHPERIRVPT